MELTARDEQLMKLTFLPLAERIDLHRIAEDLWQLVATPSPTCHERAVALAFATMLRRAGAQVEVDETLYDSPSVVGRLKGNRPGKIFQLSGHLDHIDVPHAPPARTEEIISGRGSADMKNGLAAILEIVRVLSENGCDFPGEILVTAYGLHEAPNGNSAGLANLIQRGIKGEAALVAETSHSAEGTIAIQGKGQAIWNLTVKRRGDVCHELNYPAGAPDFFSACMTVAKALTDAGKKLAEGKSKYDLLSPESLFVGQMHYGDFYNRAPATCSLQGTWRWCPDKTFADVEKEMHRLLETVTLPAGMSVACEWQFVGESYAVDRNAAVVLAQQRAFQAVTGKPAAYRGLSVVTDTNRLVPQGNVPTVLCGFDNEFAHADYEYVRLDRLLEPCRIALLTGLNYLSMLEGDKQP